MNQQKQFQFYVVELPDSSYTKLNKYICVPNSWISLCETTSINGMAVVEFPVGILPDAKLPDGKKDFSDNRRIFMADIKYGTDKYEDAKDYIKILEKISNREQRHQKILKEVTPLDKEPLTSLSSLRTTNQTEENERNNYAEPNTNQTESKQMHLDNFKIGICQEQSELIEPIDLTNKDKIYAVRSSKTYSSVTTGDSSTIQNKSMVDCDKINPKDQNNKETESSVSENQKLTNESNLFAISRPLFGENFLPILKKIYSDFEKQQMLLDTMRLAFQQQCIVLKNIIELTDKFNNFNIDDSNSAEEEIRSMEKNEMNINQDVSNKTEEELSKEVEINEENKEEGKSNEDINCNDDTEIKDSEKNNLPKKIRGQARTFTLPKEYDPNNSRWTLKYRKKKKGLVELLPNSRIYIDAIKLNNCKRIAKDSKTLARMLLVEIFSKTALSTCSLTGKKANAYDTDGTCIRPGLDEHARIVLLTYVEQYTIEQKWVKLETQLILGTLRNKLQEMRTKYG